MPRKVDREPAVASNVVGDGVESSPKVLGVKPKSELEFLNLAQRLKELELKFSKNFLAASAKVTRRAIDKYFAGQTPSATALAMIALATGCSPAWLLTGEGQPFPPERPDDPAGQAALAEGMRRSAAAAIEALYGIAATAPLANSAAMLPNVTQLAAAASAAASAIAERLRLLDMSGDSDITPQKKSGQRKGPPAGDAAPEKGNT